MAGKMDQAKGRVKKAAGELTGSERLKGEGMIDKAAGKLKSGLEKVRKTIQRRERH